MALIEIIVGFILVCLFLWFMVWFGWLIILFLILNPWLVIAIILLIILLGVAGGK